MRPIILSVVFAAGFAVAAGDPAGYLQWTSAERKAIEAKEIQSMGKDKTFVALELANFGTHSATMSHRLVSGEAEIHDNTTDVFYVQSGGGEFIVGGTIADARTTGPGETRGTTIKGGVSRKLSPGDIVVIPVKTAHQIVLPKGVTITYLVMKAKTR